MSWTKLFGLMLWLVGVLGEGYEKYFLPGDVVPTHYDLEFYPEMNEFGVSNAKTFKGSAVITLVAVKDGVSTIVLNCKHPLAIKEAVLLINGKPPLSLGNGVYEEETEKVTFPLGLGSSIKQNDKFRLNINFIGEHMTEEKGFFYLPTAYGNNSSFLLVTHLQPNNARLVFPCFDEPKYKALVRITVGIPTEFVRRGYKVLSNTEEESVEEVNGRHIYHFKTTPLPISTYLVAMAVSTFESTPPRYFNSPYPGSPHTKPKALRTWAHPDLLDKANLMQIFGQAILEIYTNDFQIGFGFDKLDHFIMNSFLSGMENWGLITHPEKILTGSSMVKVSRDVSHEINHQWFGNLVTTHSWSDVWLNEAFAQYFQFFAAEKINVTIMDASVVEHSHAFVVEAMQGRALVEDSYDYTHPLTVNIYEPRQAWCYFDEIEYDKGASFLRMVENVLGHGKFYKALRRYLAVNKEKATKPEDLLSVFDYVAKESESDLQGRLPSGIFRDWHLQEGYPVVEMSFKDGLNDTVVLTQEIFRLGSSKKFSSHKWNIPISYATNVRPNFTDTRAMQWLWKENPSLVINLGADVKWIVINNLETGYYRVNYQISNWMSLFHALRNPETREQIHEMNRAQIIDDAANLARSTAKDYLSYKFFMNLTAYLENETSYYVWEAAFNNLDFLDLMMRKNPDVYPLFQKHIIKITHTQLKSLTMFNKPEDTYQDNQLRNEIVSWSVRMDNTELKDEILKLYNENSVPGNLKSTAKCLQVRSGGQSLSEGLWEKYQKAENITEKLDIITALGCTKDTKILTNLLKASITPNRTITDYERSQIFKIIHGAPENIHLLLNFVYNHPLEIYYSYGQRRNFDELLLGLARQLGTDEELNMLKAVVTKIQTQHPEVLHCKGTAAEVLEIVQTNNVWLKRRGNVVSEWLSSEYGPE